MSTKSNLIIIDDEPDFLSFIREVFEQDFNTMCFESGQQGLAQCQQSLPDIVLLDIGLIDIDGFEVCRKIKQLDPNDACSIIFVSGHDSLDERMHGYSLGADDFIAKPVSIEELEAKVHKVSYFQQQKKRLSEQEKTARDMAFQAMTEASQYGALVQFVKQVQSQDSFLGLSQSIIDTLSQLSLHCCVQIRTRDTASFRANGESCSPIEEELFSLLKDKGRVYSFKQRCMFNDKHVSLLVTNMPEDSVSLGQIRDLLAVVVEVTETTIVSMGQRLTLETALQGIQSTINTVANGVEKQKAGTRLVISQYLSEMEASLGNLGMTEEQENYFMERAEQIEQDLFDLSLADESITQNLEYIIQHIRQCIH